MTNIWNQVPITVMKVVSAFTQKRNHRRTRTIHLVSRCPRRISPVRLALSHHFHQQWVHNDHCSLCNPLYHIRVHNLPLQWKYRSSNIREGTSSFPVLWVIPLELQSCKFLFRRTILHWAHNVYHIQKYPKRFLSRSCSESLPHCPYIRTFRIFRPKCLR